MLGTVVSAVLVDGTVLSTDRASANCVQQLMLLVRHHHCDGASRMEGREGSELDVARLSPIVRCHTIELWGTVESL